MAKPYPNSFQHEPIVRTLTEAENQSRIERLVQARNSGSFDKLSFEWIKTGVISLADWKLVLQRILD